MNSDDLDTIRFRPATPADSEEVTKFYLASRKIHIPLAPLAHSDDEVRKWIAESVIPAGGVTVAVFGRGEGRVIGVMAIQCRRGIGWLDHLYLHPSLVGRGTGTLLLERAMAELGPPFRLYTFEVNSGARRFYERHGFRAIAFGDGSGNVEGCPDIFYEWGKESYRDRDRQNATDQERSTNPCASGGR